MLRQLRIDDADRMMEWMHNESIVRDLHSDFMNKEKDDCISFILQAETDISGVHFAITDSSDIYLGTVSLRIANPKMAEFAIVMHPDAIGKGIARGGMKEIISYGINKMGLELIFWCVSKSNFRAIKFYESQEYERFSIFDVKQIYNYARCRYSDNEINDLIWYKVSSHNQN